MRIASSQFEATMTSSLQVNQTRLAYLTAQMSSGLRVQVPSDDPIAAIRISRLTREEAAISQYRDNIGALKIRLQQNETYMDSMVRDLGQARDLMVWALDGGNTPADLNAMTSTVLSLRDSLFYTANMKDQEGRYIFSGTLVNSQSITFDAAAPIGSRYSFTGNTAQQQVVVGNGVTQPANVDMKGMDILLNWLDQAADTLQTPNVTANDPAAHAALAMTLDNIDTAMGMVSGKIAGHGGAQNILSGLDQNHANVSLSNQTALVDLSQLDYGAASVDLNGYTLALQATQKAYAKVSGLSLFNVL